MMDRRSFFGFMASIPVVRGSKITPMTRERKDQINAARQLRIAQGRPDRIYQARTLHERVVGLTMGNG